jgi:hypothetical protein
MLVKTVHDDISSSGEDHNAMFKQFGDIMLLDDARREIVQFVTSTRELISKLEEEGKCDFDNEIVPHLHHFFVFLTKQGVSSIDSHQHTIFNVFLCGSAINYEGRWKDTYENTKPSAEIIYCLRMITFMNVLRKICGFF